MLLYPRYPIDPWFLSVSAEDTRSAEEDSSDGCSLECGLALAVAGMFRNAGVVQNLDGSRWP